MLGAGEGQRSNAGLRQRTAGPGDQAGDFRVGKQAGETQADGKPLGAQDVAAAPGDGADRRAAGGQAADVEHAAGVGGDDCLTAGGVASE